MIRACALQSQSYSAVVEALKQKYGREDLVKHALPLATDTDLRDTADQIDRVFELLRYQGEPINTLPLLRAIEKKLPRSVIEDLERTRRSKPRWNVETLCGHLSDLVISRENIARSVPEAATSHRTKRFAAEPTAPLDTSAFTTMGPKKQANQSHRYLSQKMDRECSFCKHRGHRPHECRKVASAEARVAVVTKEKLCFLCLKPGHRSVACQARPCFKCNRKHHPALCDPKAACHLSASKEQINRTAHAAATCVGSDGDVTTRTTRTVITRATFGGVDGEPSLAGTRLILDSSVFYADGNSLG